MNTPTPSAEPVTFWNGQDIVTVDRAQVNEAAPALLHALRELLAFAEPLGVVTALDGKEIALPCITNARAAIEQATGDKP